MPKKAILYILFAVFFCFGSVLAGNPSSIFAQAYPVEVITNFSSKIQVEKLGTLLVTEDITVYANNEEIKHGIYRDFPTLYKDKLGNKYKIDFQMVLAKRDGVAEPFHFGSLSNGIRVYLGDSNVIIPPGMYTYELVYRVNRELGFFSDHDELYWNVTGSGWNFNIEKSEATVILPFNIDNALIKTVAYSGIVGTADSSAVVWYVDSNENNNSVTFQNSKQLSKGEDFSIVVGWPKGLVKEPTQSEKVNYWIKDNTGFLFGLLGLVALLAYFIFVWNKYGRDPKKESIIPIYEPPAGLSPSSARYLTKTWFDEKCFLSEIINLAVKGYLRIEKKIKRFNLIKIKNADSQLSASQSELLSSLFSKGDILELGGYDPVVMDAQNSLKSSLSKSYGKDYFTRNTKYFIFGVIFSLIILLFSASRDNPLNAGSLVFLTIWLSGWNVGVIGLISAALKAWQNFALKTNNKVANFLGAFILSGFAIPFLGVEIFMIHYMLPIISTGLVSVISLVIALNIVFYFLLWQYTEEGFKLVNQIKGFKWFLSVTEQDRMNFFNPPEKTPELFERYLPYALALGVENQWAEQFAEVFARQDMAGKSPLWYSGSIYGLSMLSDFNSSLSSSVASSVTPPGRSSGFGGGGGGSGGGGGGGGGGGW